MVEHLCSIPDCGKPVRARGWCTAHWTRWKRHGAPTARVRGEVIDGRRVCPMCKQDVALSDWYRRPEGKYVSCAPCQRAYLRAKQRAAYVPAQKQQATCEVCGGSFMADKRRRLTCSPECKKVGINKRNWKHVQKRRAAVREATVELFEALEIFERDDWMCGLCSDAIDRNARAPRPDSPSIAAHLGCNVRKGARLIEIGGLAHG